MTKTIPEELSESLTGKSAKGESAHPSDTLTPLVKAILFSDDDATRMRCVLEILENSPSPAYEINRKCESEERKKMTAMHAAIEMCDFEVLKVLLATPGAEPRESRCMQGGTLYHWYAEHGGRKGEDISRAMSGLLFQILGPEIIQSVENDSETPIFWARSSELQMKVLLENGARANDVDVVGDSVLTHALRMRAEPVVQLIYDSLKFIPGAMNDVKQPEILCRFIDYLPDSNFLLTHLDSGVHFTDTQPNGNWYYQFNIGMVEPPPGTKYLPLHFIVEKESKAVTHPLVQEVMHRKWEGYVKVIYAVMLFLQILRVAMLSWSFNLDSDATEHTMSQIVFLVATIVLFSQEILVVVGRTKESSRYGWKTRFGLPSHFSQPENLTQFVDYVLSLIVIGIQVFSVDSDSETREFAMIRGVQFFLCLFATIFFLSPLERFGSLVVMLSRVLFIDLPPFIIIGGILVTAFAGLSQTITDGNSMRIPVWTSAFVFGPDQLMNEEEASEAIFFFTSVVFALAVPIALLNLMIASFSYTYQTIVEEVKVVTQLERARLITDSDILLSLFSLTTLPWKKSEWQEHVTKCAPGKIDLLASRSAELSQEANILLQLRDVQKMLSELQADLNQIHPDLNPLRLRKKSQMG